MEKEKSSKWWKAIKIILGLLVLSFIIAIFLSLFIEEDFETIDGNVGVIEIKGPIMAENGDFLFEEATSSTDITRLIRKANENERIKAIIFEINSPGGSAVASDEIASEIKKVNKTTVAWVREVGASGAYWVASSTDHIIANRMSITGSIGVIASYLGFSGFIEEHNITYERLVSGKYKDLGSPFKEMTPEERALFEKSLNQIHDYFIDEVAKNRNLDKREVQKIATGAFYLGVEAKELGLVDELGGRDEVLNYVEKQIGEEANLVRYRTPVSIFDVFGQTLNERFFYMGKGIGSSFFSGAEQPKSITIST